MSVQTYCWCSGDYDKAKAQLAALKEEIAGVRQALDGYDNHAEPVAELVKAMRHRHDDYVESICELKTRIAELEDALEQYADDYNWCYDTCNISRNIAKDALKGPGGEV